MVKRGLLPLYDPVTFRTVHSVGNMGSRGACGDVFASASWIIAKISIKDFAMPRKLRCRPLWPLALSVEEISTALHIPPTTVRAAIRSGELAAYKKGVRVVILVTDIVEWVKTWERHGRRV
jgi:excisionase family DNA binding protein